MLLQVYPYHPAHRTLDEKMGWEEGGWRWPAAWARLDSCLCKRLVLFELPRPLMEVRARTRPAHDGAHDEPRLPRPRCLLTMSFLWPLSKVGRSRR